MPRLITRITQPGLVEYPPAATFGPRAMRDYEFVWIVSGNVEYRWNDIITSCPEGSIVLCRPGGTDFFRWDRRRPTRHGYFHFDLSHVPRGWPEASAWPVAIVPGAHDVLTPMFRFACNWRGALDDELLLLTVEHMLTAFARGLTEAGEVRGSPLPEAVERALDHIRTSLDRSPREPVTLDDLAEVSLVTREHLCRLFRASLGKSPVETVRLARLDRAATLLARSNYNIAQIAEACGFASPFHFSRVFARAFGMSPTAMRQRVEAGDMKSVPNLLRRLGPQA
jgi:AraC-like DNA-binding protein